MIQLNGKATSFIDADSIINKSMSQTHQEYKSHSTYQSPIIANQYYSKVKSVPNNFNDEIGVTGFSNSRCIKASDETDYTSYTLSPTTIITQDGSVVDVLIYTKSSATISWFEIGYDTSGP